MRRGDARRGHTRGGRARYLQDALGDGVLHLALEALGLAHLAADLDRVAVALAADLPHEATGLVGHLQDDGAASAAGGGGAAAAAAEVVRKEEFTTGNV